MFVGSVHMAFLSNIFGQHVDQSEKLCVVKNLQTLPFWFRTSARATSVIYSMAAFLLAPQLVKLISPWLPASMPAQSKLAMKSKPIALTLREFNTLRAWGMPKEVCDSQSSWHSDWNDHWLTLDKNSSYWFWDFISWTWSLKRLQPALQNVKGSGSYSDVDCCGYLWKKRCNIFWISSVGTLMYIGPATPFFWSKDHPSPQDLKLLDIFSGKAAVSKYFRPALRVPDSSGHAISPTGFLLCASKCHGLELPQVAKIARRSGPEIALSSVWRDARCST